MKSFTKTTTTTFEPIWINTDAFTYDETFRKIRSGSRKPFKACCKCKRKFDDGERIGIGCFKGKGNLALCGQCAVELED